MTNGFSGADVSAVVNTAISLVLHEYLLKFPSPEEAAKHTSDSVVSSQYFEEAVKKIKKQRETKPGEPIASMVTGIYNNFREQNIVYDGKFEREREP